MCFLRCFDEVLPLKRCQFFAQNFFYQNRSGCDWCRGERAVVFFLIFILKTSRLSLAGLRDLFAFFAVSMK